MTRVCPGYDISIERNVGEEMVVLWSLIELISELHSDESNSVYM